MRKSRFTEAQIIGMIKEQEAGMPTEEVCRKHGLSQGTFYKFKSKYGGMEVSDAAKLKALEDEKAGIRFRRSRAVPRFLLSTFECNIYRVVTFRASCPFRGHELAGPCSTEHPGIETRPRPQPGGACSSGRREPRPYGQGRERQVRGLPRPSRTYRQSTERRSSRALHKTLASFCQPLMRPGAERLKR